MMKESAEGMTIEGKKAEREWDDLEGRAHLEKRGPRPGQFGMFMTGRFSENSRIFWLVSTQKVVFQN
jgi:hypothetical protein